MPAVFLLPVFETVSMLTSRARFGFYIAMFVVFQLYILSQNNNHTFSILKVDELKSFELKKMRVDNTFGMLFSQFATWSIIVVAATVLNHAGVKDVKTAADAAKALEPLVNSFPNSGFLAKIIFSVGIIGLGLLAIPVLSGSASYAVSEALGWEASLDFKFKKAPGFYGVIIAATLVGLILNFLGINPVKALVYAAVLNGIAAVPLLFLIIQIASKQSIMGVYKTGLKTNILLWITFITMGAAAVGMFFTI